MEYAVSVLVTGLIWFTLPLQIKICAIVDLNVMSSLQWHLLNSNRQFVSISFEKRGDINNFDIFALWKLKNVHGDLLAVTSTLNRIPNLKHMPKYTKAKVLRTQDKCQLSSFAELCCYCYYSIKSLAATSLPEYVATHSLPTGYTVLYLV